MDGTSARTRVLVVDDDEAIGRMIARALRASGAGVDYIGEAGDILALANRPDLDDYDVILLDVGLASISGLDVLVQLRQAGRLTAVVMLTGDETSATAITALHAGAFHYLTKPLKQEEFLDVVGKAVSHTRLIRELARPDPGALVAARNVVGSSVAMTRLRGQLPQIGRAEVSVLITGESGTGKEVVARALHDASPRRRQPFIALNCGAIASDLIDSELFGHTRGAFTGAVSTRAGVFVQADGGTLFLDEIGDMPLPVQTRLLRALQEGEIRAVGGEGTQQVNVRILAATNVDLARAVQAGSFRADLYFRLNVVNVMVPPLRERQGDVPELIAALLLRHAATPVPTVTIDALEALTSYPWPGNVRELENALLHALAMHSHGVIDAASLPPTIGGARRPPHLAKGSGVVVVHGPLTEAKRRAAADFEREYLIRTLEHAKGSVAAAARAAGIDRTNFRRLLQRYGIDSSTYRS